MTTVDLLVVGAGSGGCVVAARASEDPARSVLLVEAGPALVGADVPPSIRGSAFLDAVAEPGWSWPGLVVRRSLGQGPRPYRRGRGLGGSSAINAMVATSGEPGDYDRWAALGATGWDGASLAPWFGRTALTLTRAPDAQVGPLSRAIEAIRPKWAERALLTRDTGGHRVSAADAYLVPALGRPNLEVRGDALVERILFDGDRAAGVRLAGGEELLARHVVLAAGALHTPAILLRSGVDRPGVGAGLQDHPSVPITLLYHEGLAPDPETLGVSVIGRFSSGTAPNDLQLLPMDHLGPEVPGTAVVMVALMDVASRGTVTIAGDDPTGEPVVEMRMLSDPEDLRRLRIGAEAAIALVGEPAVRRLATPVVPDISDDGLLAGLGEYVHAAGTCRMGSPADPLAVVDPLGAVIGRRGLSIADASVFPVLPRANTHLPVVAVAERLCSLGGVLGTSR